MGSPDEALSLHIDQLLEQIEGLEAEVTAKDQQIETLETLSRTCPITDMRNVRSFEEELQRQLGLIARGDRSSGEFLARVSGSLDGETVSELGEHLGRQGQLSLIYADLVGFKAPNDKYGWEFGNQLLIAVGRLLEGCCRDTDLAYRIGGDEFALILIDCGEGDAWEVVNRITEAAAEFSMPTPTSDGGTIGIEFYIGLAAYEDGMSMQDLREAADAQMGAAKKKREQTHGPSR